MFKFAKAVFNFIKVVGQVVGALMALQALLTTVVVALGFKHEAKRAGNKIEVNYNVEYDEEHGSNIGVANGFIAFAVKNRFGKAFIVTDDVFETLSFPAQCAIVAHEEGHIALGHLDTVTTMSNPLRPLYQLMNKVQPVELEADLYAAKKTSVVQVIEMLEELKTLPGIKPKELDLRIKALQKHL